MVKQSGPGTGSVQLSTVRAARQQGFDRVVFELAGEALPGYHPEYVDKPLIRCGSGEPTAVAGQGWLQVRFTGAVAHTQAGKPTAPPRARAAAEVPTHARAQWVQPAQRSHPRTGRARPL